MPGQMEAMIVNCSEGMETPPVPPRRFNMDLTPQSPPVPPRPKSPSHYESIGSSPHPYSSVMEADPFGTFQPIKDQDALSSRISNQDISPVVLPVVNFTTHPGLLANFRIAMETCDPRRTPLSSPVYDQIEFNLDPMNSRSSTPSTGSSTITAEHDGKQTGNDPNLSINFPTGSGRANKPMLSPVDGAVRAGSLSARDYLESGWKRETGEGLQSDIDRGYDAFSRGIIDREVYPWYAEDNVRETGKLFIYQSLTFSLTLMKITVQH